MTDFIHGFLFLPVYIISLWTIGSFIFKKGNFFKQLIAGYLIYYLCQFVLGVIFQYFLLPLNIYFYIVGAALAILCIYSIYRFIRSEKSLTKVKKHFQDYWLVYVVSIVLLALSVFYAPGNWLANNLDDGYYVTKIFNYIKGININIDASNGFETTPTLERLLNTFELDLASYCYLFKIDVLIFVNYFYTWFNYFFICAVLVEFFEEVFHVESKKVLLCGGLVVIFFFAMYPKYLELLMVGIQDGWQFNTAIWYGSSIVRIPGMFIIFMGMFWHRDDVKKQIVHFIICGCVLMSKASQALPALLIAGIINICVVIARSRLPKAVKLLPYPIIIALAYLASTYIDYVDEIAPTVNSIFVNNFTHPLLLFAFISFLALTIYYRRNRDILQWNLVVMGMIALIYIDGLNSLAIAFSIYAFVACRTVTLVLFTVLMTTSFEAIYFLSEKLKKPRPVIIGMNLGMSVVMLIVAVIYIGPSRIISCVAENPSLRYNTVMTLSKKLGQLDEENGDVQLRVIAPHVVYEGKYQVAVDCELRYYAADAIIVSNEIRYTCHDEDNIVSNYDVATRESFTIINNEAYNDDDFNIVMETVEETETNCIVVTNEELLPYYEEYGFELYDTVVDNDGVIDYYILYNG